jgi:hypothetical protein
MNTMQASLGHIHSKPVRLSTLLEGSVKWLIVLLSVLMCSAPLRANTYMFSFTTQDLMTAFQTAQGSGVYTESAYFAFFVQPTTSQISSYSYVSETAPTDPNQWQATTVQDYSDPNYYFTSTGSCTTNCTWAEFTKNVSLPNSSNVTVISGANGGSGGNNIFKDSSFAGGGLGLDPPLGWGNNTLIINEIMPTTDSFSMVISTSQTLSGSYTLQGRTTALKSGNPGSLSNEKESDGIPFTLTVTAVNTVPEPGTSVLFAVGILAIGVGSIRRNP